MEKMIAQFKNGFTLAEVLITLVIIGVVAAMTIPTVINNTKKQEYVSKLKKVYSTLAQATNLIIAEEGPIPVWSDEKGVVHGFYKKKLVNAKECGYNSGCFEQGAYKTLNNNSSGTWNNDGSMYKLILSDGVQISFEPFNSACDSVGYSSQEENACMFIEADLNGGKLPNTIGRDVFLFVLRKDGLQPAGIDKEQYCNTSQIGYNCAAKVLKDGAMNY